MTGHVLTGVLKGIDRRMPRRERGLWQDLPRSERAQLRRFFRAATDRFGPLDEVAWQYARLTAEAWWTAVEASGAALKEAAKRRHGKGRRPSLLALDRRLKRQGVGVETFDRLLHRLEELAPRRKRQPTSGAELLERMRA